MGKDRLPDFFIVGSPKAATTSLYHYLTQIPEIFVPSKKSPEHYTRNYPKSFFTKPLKDKKKYLSLFNDATEKQMVGEASVFYLIDPESPKLIKQDVPNAKIVMILRHPVQRSFSHYLMFNSAGVEKMSFSERIEKEKEMLKDGFNSESYCLLPSFYHDSVKRYFDIFGKDNVKVFIFEEFVKDVQKTLEELMDFFKIDCEIPELKKETYNIFSKPKGKLSQLLLRDRKIMPIAGEILPDKIRWSIKEKFLLTESKKPKLNQSDQKMLEEIFRDDSIKLQELLGRELPWDFIKN